MRWPNAEDPVRVASLNSKEPHWSVKIYHEDVSDDIVCRLQQEIQRKASFDVSKLAQLHSHYSSSEQPGRETPPQHLFSVETRTSFCSYKYLSFDFS